MADDTKHRTRPEAAHKLHEWLMTRGGLAIWNSVNLSNPSASWTTPVHDEEGNASKRPTWECGESPDRIINDIGEVVVVIPKEVKRFNIGLRKGGDGLMVKLTEFSSGKLRKELVKAGGNAWYQFDYSHQQAVIFVPEENEFPLEEFITAHPTWP